MSTKALSFNDRPRGKVRVYCAGGCAANLGFKALTSYKKTYQDRDDCAELTFSFIDASASNLDPSISKDDIYLIEGLDGSGQLRKQNVQTILPRVKEILQVFKPLDFNIILTSLSGGTGGVISSFLVKELLTKDIPTIVIAVGDETTRLYSTNTLNSLKSFDAISRQLNKSIIMSYFYNRSAQYRTEVDKFVNNMIFDLACLFSNRHIGLDKQDLAHFLRYEKVSEIEPSLSALQLVFNSEVEKIKDTLGDPITVATLSPQEDNKDFPIVVDFQVEGKMREDTQADFYAGETVHYVISDDIFDKIAQDLENRLGEIEEIKSSKVKTGRVLSDNDEIDPSSGLIL